eukprot:48198-Prorocentrum_minimum.AAC.1
MFGQVTADREAEKAKGGGAKAYKLHWREHADYVAMAHRFNAIIVPFATLGADDVFKEPASTEDLLNGPAGPLVRAES